MSDLLVRSLLPVADPADARATCEALAPYDVGHVVAVYVVEKAGGAPDKASVEQREEYADEIFAVVEERLADSVSLETRVAYGTDVTEAIFDVADDVGATAVVIRPREGSRWIRLLTGDVALSLVTETDRPVVVLPGRGSADDDADTQADGDEEQYA
jgi:nucleotide-binding universal stress UspA family protein